MRWRPPSGEPTQFRVVAIHGLGGWGGDFEPLAQRLATLGGETWALNLRGQGCDPIRRLRGHFNSVQQWLDDVEAFTRHVHACGPETPLLLVGESLGASVLTVTAAQPQSVLAQANGILLLAPVPYVKLNLNPRQLRLTQLLIDLFPRLRLRPGMFTRKRKNSEQQIEPVCRQEDHRKRMENAPHRLQRFSLRFLGNVWKLVEATPAAAQQLQIPLLQLCAGRDLFINEVDSRRFFESWGTPQREFRCWPEACHLLLYDPLTEDVLQHITAWVQTRIRTPQRA
ncbi:MAG: alpha/beta fold hydrolase [Opitutales bacterium]